MIDPAHIGRYAALRPLGQGRLGRVLLARDPVLGRSVAIKTLREDLGLRPDVRAQLVGRMRDEATVTAALSHPNVVTLYDVVEDEQRPALYLIFEYIAGPTLRERIETEPLPIAEVAELARCLGDALTHAHEAGVVCHDVTADNVMFTPTGPKMVGFGIAPLPDSVLMCTDAVAGASAHGAPKAPAYATYGPQSDQRSLAVTLYEALSGKLDGGDSPARAARIATASARALGEVISGGRAPAQADSVLARAMATNPSDRFRSCREFGDALAAALMHASAPPPSDTAQGPASFVPRATRRAHNLAAAVGLFVILALLLIGRRTRRAGDGVSLKQVAEAFSAAAVVRQPAPAAGTPKSRSGETPHPQGRREDAAVATTRPDASSGSAPIAVEADAEAARDLSEPLPP